MAGRPKKYDITDEDMTWATDSLRMGLTIQDLATHFGMPHETARGYFGELHKKNKVLRKRQLLEYQWAACEKGNPTILIWMGKQLLNQSDEGMIEPEELVDTVDFELDEAS